MTGIERVLLEDKPMVVLVRGDRNTVLAGALAGSKLRIKAGQVEAGLQNFDRRISEENNRVVADHILEALSPPTETVVFTDSGDLQEESCILGVPYVIQWEDTE